MKVNLGSGHLVGMVACMVVIVLGYLGRDVMSGIVTPENMNEFHEYVGVRIPFLVRFFLSLVGIFSGVIVVVGGFFFLRARFHRAP